MVEFIKTNVSTDLLVCLGVVGLALIVWFLKKAGTTIISQFEEALKEQQKQIRKENLEGRAEREYDNYLLLRGMQVMTDLDHELVHCVMTGTHNGGLEQANTELEKFRTLSNENLVKKASKWNIKID